MFKAVGVGARKDGAKYAVKVDYFDDRATPNRKVNTLTHTVSTMAELRSAVDAQLAALKAADLIGSLHAQVASVILGSN